MRGLDQTRRIARTRLMLTQRPGDAAIDVLRELLRLDRDARQLLQRRSRNGHWLAAGRR